MEMESTATPSEARDQPRDPLDAAIPQRDVIDTDSAGPLIIRGAILRLLGYAVGAMLGLVSAILLTRYLGVHRFGQYTTIVSVATLGVMLTDAGVSSLATREFVSRDPERHLLMRDLLGVRLVLSGIAVLAAVAFAIAAGYDITRVGATALAAIGLAIASLQGLVAVPLMAGLRLGWVSGIELIRQTAVVALVAGCVLTGVGLLPILSSLIPSSLLALVITIRIVRGEMPLRPSLRMRRVGPLVRATAIFSIATSLGVAYAFAAQVLTSLVASPTQTGLFSAAFRVFSVVATSGGLLINSAFPLLARTANDDHFRLAYALQRLFEVAVILGVATGLASVTGASAIIQVVAGPKYALSAAILRIEGAALLGSFILAVLGYTLISLRRHAALVVSNGLALIVTAALTLTLAPPLGGRGTAIAVVAGEWTLAVAMLVSLARSDRALLPRLTIVAKALLACAPALALTLAGLPSGAQLFAGLAFYAVGLVATRAIPREVFETIFHHA
jgi:O-antigen/teichoic acid export membrane protein